MNHSKNRDLKRQHWKAIIEKRVDENTSVKDIAKELKTRYNTLRKYCKRYKIELPQNGKGVLTVNALVKDFKGSMGTVKSQLIGKLNSKECSKCGTTKWKGKNLKMELDHINGDRHDNRIGNLQYLCPNCHSQTDTFRHKNKKHSRKIEDIEFVKALKENTSITTACRALMIPPVKGHFIRALKLAKENRIDHILN